MEAAVEEMAAAGPVQAAERAAQVAAGMGGLGQVGRVPVAPRQAARSLRRRTETRCRHRRKR